MKIWQIWIPNKHFFAFIKYDIDDAFFGFFLKFVYKVVWCVSLRSKTFKHDSVITDESNGAVKMNQLGSFSKK